MFISLIYPFFMEWLVSFYHAQIHKKEKKTAIRNPEIKVKDQYIYALGFWSVVGHDPAGHPHRIIIRPAPKVL